MELIRPFERLGKADAGIAGGKGASLGEMTQAGIPVPSGFVVLAGAFERFLEEADLNQELDAILHAVKHDDIATVEHASEKIKALITGVAMPADIASEIMENFAKLGADYVAVRSSATAEDGASAAWAGQLETYLNTKEADLIVNVQKCWASLFTPRAIFYRFEKGMHGQKISVAVVVQKMVQSESSGIAFSVHPVTEDYNQLIIEAGFGLGEAIVSGQVTPDSYVVEKQPRRILDKNIATQTRGLYRGEGENEWKDIAEPKASSQVLLDDQILELADLVLKIEQHYGTPQDIEWAFEGRKFYITQSRPITTLKGKSFSQSRLLTKVYSREKKLYYFDLWSRCDSEGVQKLLGVPLRDHLFILAPEGKKGQVWFGRDEMVRLKDMAVEALQDTGPDGLIRTIEANLQEGWDFLKPFAMGTMIGTLEEWKEYDKRIHQFYAHFNSVIWEASDDARVPQANKDVLLSFRNQTEQYSERMSVLATDFFASQYPQHAHLSHVLTFDEMWGLANGDAKKATLEAYTKRLAGCFILNDVVHDDMRELDAALKTAGLSREQAAFDPAQGIKGISAAPGKARGRVVIVDGKTDLRKVKEGDIFVTQSTNPEYVPQMKLAAAIVTEEGGMLSHAAITARELGKPCVIGTGIVTEVLKDGDEVEVDADAGLVRVISSAQGDVSSLLKPENYRFVGLYKCLPFASWFWVAWYSKEKLDALGLSIDFGGYCGIKGGNNLINAHIAEQFKARLLDRVESDDMRYFSALESQAAEEFEKAVKWTEGLDKRNDIVAAYTELVEKAKDIMFYWFIGWLSSQSIDETLRRHAEDAHIPTDEISSYIAQPDTPLIRQQAEARKLKELLIKKGVWELLKTDSQKAIESITADAELNTLITMHVHENEWLPIINFVGEKFTVEKLLEQMSFFKDAVDSSHSTSVPKSFEKYARIASHIGYLNQASAEYFSIFTNKIMPFLESIAKRLNVSYRDLLLLVPEEVAAGLENKLDVRPIIQRRQNDNWIIYTAPNHEIRVIDDMPTVEAIADKLLPKPDITDASVIKGQIGNKGKATGPARIIIATDDFHKMQDGDVLVTPMTTPDFVLLMQKSSAIVTDMGGMLSHAAIVSREMGKPCVIDTKFATKLLKDGDMIEVDANEGIIRLIKDETRSKSKKSRYVS